ncbi:hypothetical protein ABZ532_29910 [Streptomyces sp. NPDC019396]|uniref:hypothetical protein n=1 Tax=Streptomyces sp. NPDC019396 TaxID=3154687 RepID=UPI0033E5C167
MADDDKKPRTPADFRELLQEVYEVPEVEEGGKRRQRRKARRQARRTAKTNRKTTMKQVLEEERAKEPMNPAGAALIIVVILVVGFGATKWITGDDKGQQSVSTAPSAPAADPAGGGTTASSPPSPSASASPSASLPAVDLSAPEKTAEGWGRVYMTRNPPVDREHETVVERAAPWMTEALARNLAGTRDSLWDNLISNGGVSTVTGVEVGKADEELGIDTPLRAWREVKVKTVIEGYKKYDKTYVFQAEMTRDGDQWRVSRVLGV